MISAFLKDSSPDASFSWSKENWASIKRANDLNYAYPVIEQIVPL